MTDQAQRDKVTGLIKEGKTAMLTTVDLEGRLVSRPMALRQIEFDGDLWFFTSKSSTKADEVENDSRANVSFESGQSWVSISGEAELVEDRAKAEELWNTFVKAYFPGGLEDPNLILLKIQATSAEYWDGHNKLISIFKMAKAAATDTVPDMGDNKEVKL